MSSYLLSLADSARWAEVLERCGEYDVYHLPQYHAVAEHDEQAVAKLFVLESEGHICALPFLVRPIAGQPWLQATGLQDAVSVYGYAGPLCSATQPDHELARQFQEALLRRLADEHIVSLFCRLHPLIGSDWLLEESASIVTHGSTVVIEIDAGKGEEGIGAQMSGNRRREVRKLRDCGVVIEEGVEESRLAEFVVAYHQTMRRTAAGSRYYFDLDHFQRLRRALGERLRLFTARDASGTLLAAILVFACRDILQYHLSATPDHFVRESAVKLLLAEAALWGLRRRYRWLHLGGGVGASTDDGVFQFKRGFSSTLRSFRSARCIAAPQEYSRLCASRQSWTSRPADSFFPAYRAIR